MEFGGSIFGSSVDCMDEFDIAFSRPLEGYSIHDMDSGGDMMFNGQSDNTQIILFGAFEEHYAEEIIRNKNALKFGIHLYDNPEYARLEVNNIKNVKSMEILAFKIDITKCLDLLNMAHLNILKDYYEYGIRHKLVDKRNLIKDPDMEAIRGLNKFNRDTNRNNFNIVRSLVETGKPIYNKSRLRETTYIRYVVLESDCIKGIKKY